MKSEEGKMIFRDDHHVETRFIASLRDDRLYIKTSLQ